MLFPSPFSQETERPNSLIAAMRRPQSSSPSSTSTNSNSSTNATNMGSSIGLKKGGGGRKNNNNNSNKNNNNNKRINVFARLLLSSSNNNSGVMFLALGCFSCLMAGYSILSSSSPRQQQQQQQQASARHVITTTGSSSSTNPAAVVVSSTLASASTTKTENQATTAKAAAAAANVEQEEISQSAIVPSSSFQRIIRNFPSECSIYMAPSSIKTHPGLGIFTTRDIEKGMPFLQAPDGPSIPVVGLDRVKRSRQVKQFTGMFDDYWWGRGVADHVFFEDDEVIDFQITFGSLPNHHCILDSLNNKQPDIPYDDSLFATALTLSSSSNGGGAGRFTDPGAGAFSYSMGRSFVAKQDLAAGSEIFLNYGHCDRHSNKYGGDKLEWTHHMPMPEDYKKAASILSKFWQEHQHDEEYEFTPPTDLEATVSMLLPESRAELDAKLAKYLSNTKQLKARDFEKELFRGMAREMASTPRSPEWIRQHGMCLEHLIPYPSQIPHAGQGALAQHFIARGDLVVPVPFLHVLDKNALLYPSFHQPESAASSPNNSDDEKKKRMSWQVLLNYCFSHEESSLLLCPNTNAILLNHCSTRRDPVNGQLLHPCGHADGPNADYRWSAGDWDPTSPAWLNMTLDEIAQHDGRGLSMEIFSVRDIHPGEEVMIDYGPEWEEAWADHVKHWSPPPLPPPPLVGANQASSSSSLSSWLTAKEANLDETAPILEAFITNDLRQTTATTDSREQHHQHHSYLFTACQYETSSADEHEVYHRKDFDWQSLSDEKILSVFSDDASHDYDDVNYEWHSDKSHWPCSVLLQEESRQDGDSSLSYTVRIHQSDWYDSQPWNDNYLPRILTHYPRSGIHYFVQPGESDQHLPGAFRHAIYIRDEMFPPQWKNRPKGQEQRHVEQPELVVEEEESL